MWEEILMGVFSIPQLVYEKNVYRQVSNVVGKQFDKKAVLSKENSYLKQPFFALDFLDKYITI